LGSPMPSRRMLSKWHRRESNPQSPRFELGRFADLRTVPWKLRVECPESRATGSGLSTLDSPLHSASPAGFEPAISCVTGKRALQAAPRGQNRFQCPERESNPQTLGFKPSRSASLAYLGQSGPGRTRTVDRHLVGVLPSPLGYRTVLVSVESPGVAPESPACHAGVFLLDHDPRRKPWDSNPQAALHRHLFSRQAPHPAGWLPLLCTKGCGGWNRTNMKTFRTSRPTVRRPRIELRKLGEEDLNLRHLVQGQEACR
jgi:hypothetical protein